MSWTKENMADEVIGMFKAGSSINLGIGLPTLIAERISPDSGLMIHSENGVMGVAGRPEKGQASPTLINAGKESISVIKGASFFDSALSFGMIRGGHIDYCVMGGMEVDVSGSLANWMIPGKKVTGMGGAMDLVHGTKNLVVMLYFFARDGSPKLKQSCSLPLTGKNVVDVIVTDMGIFKPGGECFEIVRLAPGVSSEDLKLDPDLLEGGA